MEKINFEDLKGIGTEIKNTHINIGTGEDLTIKELSELVKSVVGFNGKIEWDNTKPDGTKQKLLNVQKINYLGWIYKKQLNLEINEIYIKYLE